MADLSRIAPAFVEMAHRIVWCSAASVDRRGRPRSRVLHPIWQWNGERLVGWIGTGPTPTKRAHLDATPYLSLNYWHPSQDTCTAECRAEWAFDDETRTRIWELLKNAPAAGRLRPRRDSGVGEAHGRELRGAAALALAAARVSGDRPARPGRGGAHLAQHRGLRAEA